MCPYIWNTGINGFSQAYANAFAVSTPTNKDPIKPGLFVTAIMSVIFLPPCPKSESKYRYIYMFLQWALFPINMIIFGSIPAIDAQTRLATGRYLGFNVTKKNR